MRKSRPNNTPLLSSCARNGQLLALCLLTPALASCAVFAKAPSMPTTQLVPELPETVRERCEGTPLPAKNDDQGRAAFGVLQTGKLELCDGKRALAVQAFDLDAKYRAALAEQLRPPTLWERFFGKRSRIVPTN